MNDKTYQALTDVLTNGGKTGHPPGLLQDDCRKLSKWLASRINARQKVREVCKQIAQERNHEKQVSAMPMEKPNDHTTRARRACRAVGAT